MAARVLDEIVTALDPALALVERSPLPAEMKASYARILRERANALVPRGDPG